MNQQINEVQAYAVLKVNQEYKLAYINMFFGKRVLSSSLVARNNLSRGSPSNFGDRMRVSPSALNKNSNSVSAILNIFSLPLGESYKEN